MYCRAYALRDYYPFWKSQHERSNAGKLLLLDKTDQDTLQIFFDDNIGYGRPHIVDARDVNTGQSVPFQVQGAVLSVIVIGNTSIEYRYMLLLSGT